MKQKDHALRSFQQRVALPQFWFLILVIAAVAIGFYLGQARPKQIINSFEECVKAGYPVLQIYPRQCKTPDGKSFTEVISDRVEPTPTPEPTTVVSPKPSPAPVTIEKIPYKPIASWQTYTDSQGRFSVQYPPSYKLNLPTPPGVTASFLSCLTDPQKGEICLSGYSVTLYEDYDGGSRRAWLERKFPGFLIKPYYADVLIAGSKALIIMDGNTGGSTGSFVLLPTGNKMYLFSFPGGWNPDTAAKPGLDFIKQILSTFKFLD